MLGFEVFRIALLMGRRQLALGKFGVRPTRWWREVDSNYRFPDAPVMPRELESRELLMRTPQTRSATRSWKSRAEQKVRRLTAGGNRIRTVGSAAEVPDASCVRCPLCWHPLPLQKRSMTWS